MLYPDADGDGFGDAAGAPTAGCVPQAGFSASHNDCDDTNVAIHPGTMVCGPQGTVQMCGSNGTFQIANCLAQGRCFAQPNGTGVCVP